MSHALTVESGVALPRSGFMAWLVCLSAGLFFFYEFFQLNIFDVINQALRREYHLDATALSGMSSMFLWADILFLLPAGILLDRFSPRRIILIALLICILGTLGFALTRSFMQACFFHALTGIGHAFCFLACVVLIARWFPPKKQAMMIGIVVTMAFLGGMAAHTPFAHLVDAYGWRTALLMDACLGLIFFIWIFLTVYDADAFHQKPKAKDPLLAGFIGAIKNRHTWLGGLYTTFLNLPIMILCALWGASYLETVHHLSEFAAANTINFVFIGSIFGCPVAGWLSDSLGRRKPFMLFGALATLLVLIPLFTSVHLSEIELKILFFSLGFFTSTQVISYPLIAESNCVDHTGVATGIASVLIMGGAGLGQLVFGWLMQHHAALMNSQYTSADFQYAMWIFPLTTLLGLIAVLFSRETYCKRLD